MIIANKKVKLGELHYIDNGFITIENPSCISGFHILNLSNMYPMSECMLTTRDKNLYLSIPVYEDTDITSLPLDKILPLANDVLNELQLLKNKPTNLEYLSTMYISKSNTIEITSILLSSLNKRIYLYNKAQKEDSILKIANYDFIYYVGEVPVIYSIVSSKNDIKLRLTAGNMNIDFAKVSLNDTGHTVSIHKDNLIHLHQLNECIYWEVSKYLL